MDKEIKCNICNGDTRELYIKEQMLGIGRCFKYYQCIVCGHAHLESIPENIGDYYDVKTYYSFNDRNSFTENSTSKKKFKTFLKKILINISIKNSFLFSAPLKALLTVKGINHNKTILDFGCGAGQFVKELNEIGFSNARGYDLYLPRKVDLNGEVYLSNNLSDFDHLTWDIITLNHVFEHVNNPIETLKDLGKLSKTGGTVVLRFPVIDSFAFQKYKENWVQFDAPRHINLFTRKSIKLAVEKIGYFELEKIYDDSFHFQFTGSELYLKHLSLNSKDNNRKKRLMSFDTYKYHFIAKKLNKVNQGDQIVVVLRRI